ncbi:transcription regulator protein BACH1b [Anguilla rostrata]|uniref:transcription regulator protein BACH1b n=1 Tax=Anguilla rostrata TaxID=7938 RepID=UPI0030CDFA44
MSFESPRSSVFTFQSSVHSSHVLRSLNEQRKRDVLCDLTVVVENKGFRAHRSVLASCSEYFHTRVTSLVGQGLVVTLPDEVTVEGFDPLLEFAYTAKLLFTKENILEIRRCATVLGFHDLDKACFDFLIPKFFDSSRSAQAIPRRVCCRKKFWREKSAKQGSGTDADAAADDEVIEVKEESRDVEELVGERDPEETAPCAKPANDAPGSLGQGCSGCPAVATPTDPALLCLKYRKFQNACGRERSSSPQVPSSSSSSSSSSLAPAAEGQAPPVHPRRQEGSGLARAVSGRRKSEADSTASENEAAAVSVRPPPALAPLPGNPDGGGSGGGFGEALDSGCSPSVGSAGAEPDCCTVGTRFPPCSAGQEEEEGGRNHAIPAGSDLAHPEFSSAPGQQGGGERSTVEREVPAHLAESFWCAYLDPPGESSAGPSAGYRWCKRLAPAPGGLDCPFLRDQGLPQAGGRSYDSSPNSGDDSDTEGASVCSSTQRAPEVQLPFPVEQIVSLSRNDFQNVLKEHRLTREQLDFVQDVRRRSKNCIAARRCRKRKLDCIYSLECEIEKLRCEKQTLEQERTHLAQVKRQTWQDISGLCQKVLSEAALQPEQLHVLAKYATPDCPRSSLLAPLTPPSASACPSVDPCPGETHRDPQVPLPPEPAPAANHDRTSPGSAPGGRGLCSIADVCLDMSRKCARDE